MPQKTIKIFKKYWSAIIAGIIIIVGIISYSYFDQKLLGFISFVLGPVLVVVKPLVKLCFKKDYSGGYEKIIEDYRTKYKKEFREKKKLKTEKKELKFEKTELTKMLSKIRETLQRENISKEELIKSTSSSLKAIIFFKNWEDTANKRGLFLKEVYPDMGIISLRAGLSILPPKRIRQDWSNEKIVKWFQKKILKKLPDNYEFNMLIISIINLKETTSFKRLEPYRKFQISFLDKIPVEELIPVKEMVSYLHNKKHLASKDIIEVPNIVFLVEDYLISKKDMESLKKNNNKILEKLKKATDSEEIRTTDLALIEDSIIEGILKNYVSEPKKITERIKENAIFWKDYFERRRMRHDN